MMLALILFVQNQESSYFINAEIGSQQKPNYLLYINKDLSMHRFIE